METPENPKKRRLKSAIGTFLITGLQVLLLIMLGVTAPNPPLGDGGMIVSLGEYDAGGDNPAPVEDPGSQQAQQEDFTETKEEVITQETDDAIALDKQEEEKREKKVTDKPTPKPEETKEPQVEKRALFKKGSGTGGHGSGENPGNEGSPDGSPDGSPGGTGLGTDGTGIGSFNLKGRRVNRYPDVKDDSKSTGKVVVAITVDKYGKVIKALPGDRGTTTTDVHLWDKSKRAALQTEFTPKEDAPEQQFGTITFIYRITD